MMSDSRTQIDSAGSVHIPRLCPPRLCALARTHIHWYPGEPSSLSFPALAHATMCHSQVPKGQQLDADHVSTHGVPRPPIVQGEATSDGRRLPC